jgi:hypothetical protein
MSRMTPCASGRSLQTGKPYADYKCNQDAKSPKATSKLSFLCIWIDKGWRVRKGRRPIGAAPGFDYDSRTCDIMRAVRIENSLRERNINPRLRRSARRAVIIAFLAALAVGPAASQSQESPTQSAPQPATKSDAQPDEPEANPARPTVSNPATLTPVGYLQFETGTLGATNSPEFSTR